MKSVRKVKGKGGYHHNAEDNQSRCHSVGPLERKQMNTVRIGGAFTRRGRNAEYSCAYPQTIDFL